MKRLGRILRQGLLFLIASQGTLAEQMTIVYGADYKPFAWGDEQEAFGIQRDMVEEVLGKRMGLSIKHEACPWARCQIMVKQGLKDAFFTVPTQERKEYTFASEHPFYHTRFLMHTRKDNPNIDVFKKVTNLKSLTLFPTIRHIYMLGSGWHESRLSHMKNINRIKDATKIPLMLGLDRADLYIEQEEMFRYQANELGLTAQMLTFKSPVIEEMDWHLFIGKNSQHRHLLPQINNLLQELHSSGEIDFIRKQVFKKYGID